MAKGERVVKRDLVVIGGSAGSLLPLRTILSVLPANLQAVVLCVQHLDPRDRPASQVLQKFAGDSRVDSGIRCEVGHGFNLEFLEGQSRSLERALWIAFRTLKERGVIVDELAKHAREHGCDEGARAFDALAPKSKSTRMQSIRS